MANVANVANGYDDDERLDADQQKLLDEIDAALRAAGMDAPDFDPDADLDPVMVPFTRFRQAVKFFMGERDKARGVTYRAGNGEGYRDGGNERGAA